VFFASHSRVSGNPKGRILSTKIDCVVYLKSKLASEFTKLTSGPDQNIDAAQKVQRLFLSAENISDGYFAKIKPWYEPVAPKFLLTVKALNESIINGGTSASNFDEYISELVSALQA
jgi:hypothetical protein